MAGLRIIGLAAALAWPARTARAESLAFAVVSEAGSAAVCLDGRQDPAVARVAGDLAGDLASVCREPPRPVEPLERARGEVVAIGVLGQSPMIDRLAASGLLDTGAVKGRWETAVVQAVAHPWPGIRKALVVAGSDRRGAIYASYWVSEAAGISPWKWWADVKPPVRHSVVIAAGAHRLGPPAVRYRGIFLNDEDWGLRPWSSQTLDPKTGNIGPATYARVFELILRLRGNLLWPAMHPGTRAFNAYPENPRLADAYGIVMGSSHAEPMLRDNVDEWARDGSGEYNYATNGATVLRYWEERVKANARFENSYTLGMRGIHDGPMQSGGTVAEQARLLRRIIAEQRMLLKTWVSPDLTSFEQIFCPYKELLPLYQFAPELVPDDVTLVWPDDNYGYLQHFSDVRERYRSGGSGVYYHISYWGRPYDYLWLCSTPPALLGEELSRAYATGSRRLWVVNVGDLKPAEWDTEFFLRLAWDPASWSPDGGQREYLRRNAARDFGPAAADEVASVLDEYYRLNFQRKPEHVGRDAANPLVDRPVFTAAEAKHRIEEFAALRRRAEQASHLIHPDETDAYFELVQYPVVGAELMNRKWLSLELAASAGPALRASYGKAASEAQEELDAETAIYNTRVADGKWRGMMSDHPRDQAVFARPDANVLGTGWRARDPGRSAIVIAAASPSGKIDRKGLKWERVQGIGYEGAVAAAKGAQDVGESKSAPPSEWDYTFSANRTGAWRLWTRLLPTWPMAKDKPGRIAVAIDDGPPMTIELPNYRGERDPIWQRDVLRNSFVSDIPVAIAAGSHVLRLYCLDAGVSVDGFALQAPGAAEPGYVWP